MLEYIISTVGTTLLSGSLIAMIYLIRSHMTIPKGPYTWISNFCIFTLFLVIILALFLGIVYSSPLGINSQHEDAQGMETLEMKEEFSYLLSTFVSKYAMFPLLVAEVIIHVLLNIRLLWIWYSSGEWDTIVNKFLFLQRIYIIIYMLGCPVDFWLRLYGHNTFTYISMENYCSCWMIFYKSIFYAFMTSQLIIAMIRFTCVKYSIEYHNRFAVRYFCQAQPKPQLKAGLSLAIFPD